MSKWRNSFRKRRWLTVTRLMSRDGELCHLCGILLLRKVKDPESPSYITFDHVIPRSRGGLTVPANLRLAHRACNEARGNDPIIDEDAEG